MAIRKHRANRVVMILPIVLMFFGLVVIYAIGPQRANFLSARGFDYPEQYFFMRQAFFVILSIAAFIAVFKFPYERIRQFSKILIAISLGLCALLAFLALIGSGLAKCELGACRWFNLPIVSSFQPAELLKLGLVLYLAQLIAERKKEGKLESSMDFWIPYAVVSVLSLLFVVVIQKDLGTGVSLIAIVLATLFMSGIDIKKFLMVLGVILITGVLAIIAFPHRMERLTTFFGEGTADDTYHVDNAMMAIGTGGFLGVGIGNSVQATGYLPESINDSVFAVMGETFGFVGLTAVLALFVVLLLQMANIAMHLELEESLIVVGVFAWVATHVIVNIASMTGLMPLTGITLPLLSYGGTSILLMSVALGLVLQLSCYTGREERKDESISSRRGLGGTYYSSRRRSA